MNILGYYIDKLGRSIPIIRKIFTDKKSSRKRNRTVNEIIEIDSDDDYGSTAKRGRISSTEEGSVPMETESKINPKFDCYIPLYSLTDDDIRELQEKYSKIEKKKKD